MMRLFPLVIALSLIGVPSAKAATVDVTFDTVTITGDFNWSFLRGDALGLARTTAPYEIRLPVPGTPFDPAFTRPAAGGADQLPQQATVSIGNPKLLTGGQGGQVVAGVFDASPTPPQNRPANFEAHGVLFGELIRTFPVEGGVLVRPREGDYTYNLVINMTPDYSQVLSVAALFRVRTPVVGTDTFTEELFAGIDTAMLPTDVQVVPLPGAVLLLGTGLAGLAIMRRRARRS